MNGKWETLVRFPFDSAPERNVTIWKTMALLLLVPIFLLYILFAFRRQIVQLWRLNRRCTEALKKIPGPPCLPIIGAAHQFKWSNVGKCFTLLFPTKNSPKRKCCSEFSYQMEDWGRQYLMHENHYWGMVKVWVGPVPLVFCGTQESIRPILESTMNISKPNQYDIISEWIGTGLLTSTNEKWFQRRKLLTPTFHFNILQGYHDIFAQQGEILVDLVAKEEGFFDLFPYIKRCALDIICETAMGTAINSQTGGSNEYVHAVQRLSSSIWNYQR
ncbi:unnamed protein product [Heligmosomoides polygyrus]|uniref:Uncharacterized protein n=1 Tax=Heligmosomoides polygyrus TaxID=6339 RepID=A0A3P8ELS9_HELPZ|nr:unnamed protein product [Heligmosomoides polygyrus]